MIGIKIVKAKVSLLIKAFKSWKKINKINFSNVSREQNEKQPTIHVMPRPAGSPLNFCANKKRKCTKVILYDREADRRNSKME